MRGAARRGNIWRLVAQRGSMVIGGYQYPAAETEAAINRRRGGGHPLAAAKRNWLGGVAWPASNIIWLAVMASMASA